jgi:hypothetical protein
MTSPSSPAKSSSTQSNAPSAPVPFIRQLCLWDRLAEATRTPLAAELAALFDDLDEAVASLAIEQQISVAGEGLARVGDIVGLRAEIYLQEINYLLYPDQEPVLELDGFDRYVRQSMVVDLEQFCAALELPEVERGYVRSVVEPMSEAEVRAEIVAAIHEAEPSPLELAHDEDIGGWSARIADCLVKAGGSMGFWSIVELTGLSSVEVWLGLLLGAGASMERSGVWLDEEFYGRDGILVLGIDDFACTKGDQPSDSRGGLDGVDPSAEMLSLAKTVLGGLNG